MAIQFGKMILGCDQVTQVSLLPLLLLLLLLLISWAFKSASTTGEEEDDDCMALYDHSACSNDDKLLY
jgi:hypothetical protein